MLGPLQCLASNGITKEAWRTTAGTNLSDFEKNSYNEAGNRISRRDKVKALPTYWEYDLGDEMSFQRSGAPVTVYFSVDQNGNLYHCEPMNLQSRIDFPGAIPTNYFTTTPTSCVFGRTIRRAARN